MSYKDKPWILDHGYSKISKPRSKFSQNVEYGDTQSENKYINKLVKLSEKYDITDYVNESSENGLLADEDIMERFQQKLSKK